MPKIEIYLARLFNGLMVAIAVVIIFHLWGETVAFGVIGAFIGFLSDRIGHIIDKVERK